MYDANFKRFSSRVVAAFLSVAIGAFGRTGLRDILEANGRTANFQTAVQYQMFHATATGALGRLESNFANGAAWFSLPSASRSAS